MDKRVGQFGNFTSPGLGLPYNSQFTRITVNRDGPLSILEPLDDLYSLTAVSSDGRVCISILHHPRDDPNGYVGPLSISP